MPITSIIQQPAANSIQAAYRPLIFQVEAEAADGTAEPPVVYCDIYINGIYYKTLAKTQYLTLSETSSTWFFDIQDACQEVLGKYLGANGGNAIISPTEPISSVFCRFRASYNDGEGFVAAEATAPVQATGKMAAVAGTGFESNSFYILNSTLQHEHNQDLATHLSYYKTGVWDAAAFPLTHRPSQYRISKGDSDYFPFVYLGSKRVRCLKLTVKKKNGTLQSYTYCESLPPCTLIVTDVKIKKDIAHDDGRIYYNATFKINGTQDHYKIELQDGNGNWIDTTGQEATYHLTITGKTVTYNAATNGTAANHAIRITPYCDPTQTGVAGTASYTVPVCPTVNGLSISYNSTSQQLTYSFGDDNNTAQTVQLVKDGAPFGNPRTNAPSTGTFTITEPDDYRVDVTTACIVGTPITETSNTISVEINNPICSAPYNVQAAFAPDGNSVYITWQVADATYKDLVKFYDADTNVLLSQALINGGVYMANFGVTAYPNIQRFYGTVQHQCPSPSIVVASGIVQRDNTYYLDLDFTTDPQSVRVVCHRYNQIAKAPFNVTVNISLSYHTSDNPASTINTTASNVLQKDNTSQYIFGSSGIVITAAQIEGVNPATQGGFTYIF